MSMNETKVKNMSVDLDHLYDEIKNTKFSARRSKGKVLEFLNKVKQGEVTNDDIKYVSSRAAAISDLAPFMDRIKSVLGSLNINVSHDTDLDNNVKDDSGSAG